MPQSTEELVGLLELEEIEVGLYRGRQPPTSLQRVFGGQVAGQALAACIATVPEDRPVHSLHGYFLRPGDPSVPIVYDVEPVRDGGSFTSRRVVARQHGRVIFNLSSSFQVHEAGFDHQDAMPDAGEPEDAPLLADVLPADSPLANELAREWSALEVRYVGDSRPGGGLREEGHPAVARVWIRTSGPLPDDPRVHAAALTYASDLTLLGASLVPHGTVAFGDPHLQTASLDHAMWFHRPVRADRWLLYDQVSPSASGARGLSLGRIFGRDGTLVATVVQEGLIRRVA